MALKRLRDTGTLLDIALSPDAVPSGAKALEKRALLVYEGEFASMDGAVVVTADQIRKLALNHNAKFLTRLAENVPGLVPMKFCPPIQLDHSTSARDTVGRVVGTVEVGEHTLESGAGVVALYGNVRILGSENVERVEDGRWVHLSIGADFDEGIFSELTVTPFPAADEASMLSKGKPEEGAPMLKKLMEYLTARKKLNAEEAEAKLAKMTDEEKTALEKEMDDEVKAELEGAADPEKTELEAAPAEETQLTDENTEGAKLSDEETEEQKKAKEEKLSKLTAAKAEITKLSADFRKAQNTAKLAARKTQLGVRLSKLRTSMKITPAEVKKIDLTKLASESDATVNAVFKSYEDREPVIIPGVFGSTKSEDLAQFGRKVRLAKLEAETRKNMPMKAKQLSAEGPEKVETLEAVIHEEVKLSGEYQGEYGSICHLMDSGDIQGAKDALRKLMGRLSAAGPEPTDSEAQMNELAEQVKTMQNQFEQVIQLTSTLEGLVDLGSK